jgi:hypothetical protein
MMKEICQKLAIAIAGAALTLGIAETRANAAILTYDFETGPITFPNIPPDVEPPVPGTEVRGKKATGIFSYNDSQILAQGFFGYTYASNYYSLSLDGESYRPTSFGGPGGAARGLQVIPTSYLNTVTGEIVIPEEGQIFYPTPGQIFKPLTARIGIITIAARSDSGKLLDIFARPTDSSATKLSGSAQYSPPSTGTSAEFTLRDSVAVPEPQEFLGVPVAVGLLWLLKKKRKATALQADRTLGCINSQF